MNIKHIKSYFDNHKQADKFYFTSDGIAFHTRNAAINHTKSNAIVDKTIAEITRPQLAEMEKAEETKKDVIDLKKENDELQAEQERMAAEHEADVERRAAKEKETADQIEADKKAAADKDAADKKKK